MTESPSAAPRSDEERLDLLVTTYRSSLVSYATRLTGGDVARAEDVVQEVFVRAWRHLDRLTPEHGSVSGWLRRVTYNVAMDGHRMRRARPAEVELEQLDVATAGDPLEQVLDGRLVEEVLRRAWPEHRAVLVEVYLRDRTSAQAAEALGIPVGTVKSRVHYALRSLRSQLPELKAS